MTSGAYATDLNTKSSDNTLNVGDEFVVTFDENSGSTGYQWCLRASTEGVMLLNQEYFPPDKIGMSGKRVFTFKVMEPGEQGVMFELLRPWDTAHPIDSKSFIVNCL